jgi:hypothetical protein
MTNTSMSRVATSALTCGVLALAACNDAPVQPPPEIQTADVSLEISSLSAGTGEQIALALRANSRSGDAIGAFQGRVQFDPARLRYVGQSQASDAFVLVNDTESARGELRVIGTDVGGFDSRMATFVFEVVAAGYEGRILYTSEELTELDFDILDDVRVPKRVRLASDLAVPSEARALTISDWADLLTAENRGVRPDVSLQPGEYRTNLQYGDANLSGSVTGADALVIAQVAVGLLEMIVGSNAAPDRDVVVAGNVFPFNTPGLGEPGDANPPGRNADGSRSLTSTDALAIRQFAVGLAPAVVGSAIPGRGPLATARRVISSNITASETWSSDTIYEINGQVSVTNGAALTIQAGTRVEGNSSVSSALFVLRDGQIFAGGTALQPIVFTCTAAVKFKGCWSGVFIAGNASVNEQQAGVPPSPVVPGRAPTGGCITRIGEATPVEYGGCNDDDNSGLLRYVVIEYAGFALAPNVELNGLTLGGVGRGTTVEYVQVHAGLDDGIEFFGGTVNVRYLYLTANSDDSFDGSFGYNGKAQFILIQHDSTDSDKGLEMDNTETSATYGNTPRTSPQVWNLTFVGRAEPSGGVAGANQSNDAIHIRRGNGTFIANALVQNARVGYDLDDAATCVDINGVLGPNIRSAIFANVPNLGNNDSDPSPCGPYTNATEMEEAFITDPANANTITSSTTIMVSPFDVQLPDFRPNPGQALGGAAPPADPFFTQVTFIGAVEPANTTKSNAPWYSGWTRGWQSATTP